MIASAYANDPLTAIAATALYVLSAGLFARWLKGRLAPSAHHDERASWSGDAEADETIHGERTNA